MFPQRLFWSVVLSAAAGGVSWAAARAEVPGEAAAVRLLRQLPMRFEPNAGQWDEQVRFAARTKDYTVLLTRREAVLAPADAAGPVRIELLGSNPAPKIEALNPLPARTGYFLGNRPENWRSGVTPYGRVRYSGVYPGIDVVYYGNGSQLEYDFLLQPGARADRIRLGFRGADRISLSETGDLLIERGGRRVVQKRPVVFQEAPDGRKEIAANYRLVGKDLAGIELAAYDHSKSLTIDPVLMYSTYVGSDRTDEVTAVKVDSAGMVYVAGYTSGGNLTASNGAFQTALSGSIDIFVAKLNPALSGSDAIVYFTYIGGTGVDIPNAMALDASGNVYLTGSTSSTDFPMAGFAFQTGIGGTTGADAFVLKLNPSNSGAYDLAYSTYLGGNDADEGNGIDVDSAGSIYVTGTTRSGNFPLTDSAVQNGRWGPQDAFVSKLDPSATSSQGSLAYSSFFGGELEESGRSIVVTPSGTVYVAGDTFSTILPLYGNSLHQNALGNGDIFLAEMDLTKYQGESMVSSTFFGGSGLDQVRKIAIDRQGKLLVTGYTMSPDYPVTSGAAQSTLSGNADVFVTRVDMGERRATVLYSTYLGGAGGDVGRDIAGGPDGSIYVTGYTLSKDFPVIGDAVEGTYGGGVSVFVSALSPTGSLAYSSFVGHNGIDVGNGIAVTANGTVYVGGSAVSASMPTTDGSLQQNYGGGASDGFLLVIGTPASPAQ